MSLDEMIPVLKEKRDAAAVAKAEFDALVSTFESSADYYRLKSAKVDAANEADHYESEVKQYAKENFGDGSNKHPHPNVDIDAKKVVTISAYDRQAAHEWALTHNTGILNLDEKAFGVLVSGGKVPASIATCTKSIVYTPSISRKL